MPPVNFNAAWRPVKSIPTRKRRKVIHENQGIGGLTAWENELNENEDGSLLRTKAGKTHSEYDGSPACVSCHRGLVTSLVECSLCHSFSCIICARQCTAAVTTTSPTEARTGSSPLTPSNTNAAIYTSHRDMRVQLLPPGTTTLRRHQRRKLESGEAEREEYEVTPSNHGGCGRTICRRCCVENDVTHAHTCIQCMDTYSQGKHKEKEGERDCMSISNGDS